MTQQPPYGMNEVLLLLGQCTVELAWMRGKIAELEAKLDAEHSDNGSTEIMPEAKPVAR